MDTLNGLVSVLSLIVGFAGIGYVLFDQYRHYMLRRRRMVWRLARQRRSNASEAQALGVDSAGELTIAAKYAIWNYMFNILAVGGAVIGVLAGVAGYLIKDLAAASATQTALSKIQEPLAKQMDKIATANAALTLAAERVKDDKEFVSKVARDLKQPIENDLLPKIAQELFDRHLDQLRPDLKSLSTYMTEHFTDQLRGRPGADAVSPPLDAVVRELYGKYGKELHGRDGVSPSVDAVAKELALKHADALRGSAGTPGKDAVSPTAATVAGALFVQHRAELRGDPGPAGKSPEIAEIAAELMKFHSVELRGAPGLAGKDGASPEPEKIADLVFTTYGARLRGIPGRDGVNGQSPKVADVAAAVWDAHRSELRPRYIRTKPLRRRARHRIVT